MALLWYVDPGIPLLQTDRAKLTSVLRNLVSNALKYTAGGQVRIRIAYDYETNTHRLEVEDTGPGIPEQAKPAIFDRFRRVGGKEGKAGGFGLGLFIVRRFVEALGGRIRISSEQGRGTRFVVDLPAMARPRASP